MRNKLDRAWRVLATGVSFLVFGLLGLAYLPIAPFVFLWPSRDAVERFTQRCTRRTFRFFLNFMMTVGVVSDVRYRQFERLNRDEPIILVANHPTLIDVIAVISRFKQMDCVVKPEVWNNPMMAVSVRLAGYVVEENSVQVFEDCLDRLENGRSVFVFPEGTRSPKDDLAPFSRLAAQLALASGRPLYPVIIEYNYSTLRSDQPWHDVPPEPLELTLTAHDPVDPEPDESKTLKEQSQELTDRLRRFYRDKLSFMEASRPRAED
jgi:1-acyl-sn-glycerol-3-phosphate acyltransferase